MALSTDLCIAGKGKGTNLQEAKRKKKKSVLVGLEGCCSTAEVLNHSTAEVLTPSTAEVLQYTHILNIHIYISIFL